RGRTLSIHDCVADRPKEGHLSNLTTCRLSRRHLRLGLLGLRCSCGLSLILLGLEPVETTLRDRLRGTLASNELGSRDGQRELSLVGSGALTLRESSVALESPLLTLSPLPPLHPVVCKEIIGCDLSHSVCLLP